MNKFRTRRGHFASWIVLDFCCNRISFRLSYFHWKMFWLVHVKLHGWNSIKANGTYAKLCLEYVQTVFEVLWRILTIYKLLIKTSYNHNEKYQTACILWKKYWIFRNLIRGFFCTVSRLHVQLKLEDGFDIDVTIQLYFRMFMTIYPYLYHIHHEVWCENVKHLLSIKRHSMK